MTDEQAAPDFMSQLGEYADHPEIKGKVSDPQTLAKRMVDAQSEISRRLRVPGPDASPEDRSAFIDRLRTAVPDLVAKPAADDAEGWQQFYQQLGAPEAPDGYEAPNDSSKELLEALAPTAHGLGLTKKQLGTLVEKLDGLRGEAAESINQGAAKTVEALKGEWGDAYAEKMMHARLYAAQHGMEDLIAQNPTYGNNAPLLKVFAEMGKNLAENEQISTAMATGAGIMTVPEAQARRAEILSNPKHPANNQFDQGHQQALQELLQLNRYIAKAKAG